MRTIDAYDPERKVMYIGSAALVLQLFGAESKVPKAFKDCGVDGIAPQVAVSDICSRVIKDRSRQPIAMSYTSDNNVSRAAIDPSKRHSTLGYAVSTRIADGKFVFDSTKIRSGAFTLLDEHVLALPATRIIEWKLAVARERDLAQLVACLKSDMFDDDYKSSLAERIQEAARRKILLQLR